VNPPGRSHLAAKRVLVAGAVLMAIASAAAAIGAHTLRTSLAPDSYRVFLTAVLFQFLHALGLLCVGLLLQRRNDRLLSVAGDLLLAGVLLFSGSLYALLCGAPHGVGVLTPIGGLCLILGWCLAAVSLARARDTASS
jgi:uncharacterized membrane protein YgdD (TMEM256/DUF423 family)